MNNFDKNFEDLHTEAEIRTVFRMLALRNHPDCGGDNESMRLLIEAYQAALKRVDGSEIKTPQGSTIVYRYNEGEETELIEKIKDLISIKQKNNRSWTIMLIGKWLWINKTAKEDKDLLNKNGANCRWSSDKEMWYWHAGKSRHYRGNGDLATMAWKYGYSEITDIKKNESKKALAASNN